MFEVLKVPEVLKWSSGHFIPQKSEPCISRHLEKPLTLMALNHEYLT
jgi:hypothetical protein